MKKIKVLIVFIAMLAIVSVSQGQRDTQPSNLESQPDGCVSWNKFKIYGTTDVRCWDCTLVAGLAYGEPCTGPEN
jgi:hypothetical protein